MVIMSKTKKSNKKQFWMVVLGIFFVICLTIGGVYFLDNQGSISAGTMGPEGGPVEFVEGEMPTLEEAETTNAASMPARPDHDEGGTSFNSQSLISMLQMVGQILLVVIIVAGGQWLFTRLRSRRNRAPAQAG
jgi:flagellar biogenesis protein FliO